MNQTPNCGPDLPDPTAGRESRRVWDSFGRPTGRKIDAATLRDVTITIPVLNQAHYTRECLETLRRAGIADSQIVVVDNGSTDETPTLLAGSPELVVIRNDTNRGCGGAWNQGVRARPANWTVVLNNDVLAPPGWLEGLVDFAEREHFDIVSPAMFEGDADYDFPRYAIEFMERMARVKRPGVASGACFMVHRRVFEKVGLFDDDLRLGGYEDDEFFRRCRKAGFRVGTTGGSFLHHFGSITQKAMKAALKKPKASLGDREYYRKKYHLTWLKRHVWRLRRSLQGTWWRWTELALHGRTLSVRRLNGVFQWR